MNKRERAEFWQTMIETGQASSLIKESAKGQKISNSETAYNLMKPLVEKENDVEQFWIIFLNSKNKILKLEKMFSGSLMSAAVYPREIVKKILKYKAAAIIAIHNHPSGNSIPSQDDIEITWAIYLACTAIGVSFHDHTIIGDNERYSFADHQIMEKIRKKYEEIKKGLSLK